MGFFFLAGPYHPNSGFLVTSIWGSADFADVSSTPKGQESRRSVSCYSGLESTRTWTKQTKGMLQPRNSAELCKQMIRVFFQVLVVIWEDRKIDTLYSDFPSLGALIKPLSEGLRTTVARRAERLKLLLQLDTRRTITVSETLAIVTDPEGWRFTLPKTNISLEDWTSQKKISPPAAMFQVPCLFSGVYIWMSQVVLEWRITVYPAST